jgi:phage terminase small subunit
MTQISKPKPPDGLEKRGRALWRSLQRALEFDEHESQILLELCRTADVIDSLANVVVTEGVLTTGSTGQTVVHPAVVELRQQQAGFARLTAALNLSETIGSTPGSVSMSRAISTQAQAAANARWGRSKGARGA